MFPEVGVAQLFKHSEELCGDKVIIVKNAENTIIVLSDGLGSGVKANILATLTTKIISGMLLQGSSLEDVVDTVANTLPVCNVRKVAYSTFHIIIINNKGEAYVAEFDGPATLLYRNGKVVRFPVTETMVSGKKLQIGRLDLQYNDALFAVSDGVIHAGIGGLLKLGWQQDGLMEYIRTHYNTGKKSEFFSRELINCCEGYYLGKAGDDTTAVVIKIRKPHKLIMMIGPPMDKNMDKEIVDKLINFNGKKIVSGGTTASIVSRYLNKPVKVDISTISSEIPPIGSMDGVDLVTEGILTVNAVSNRLRSSSNRNKSKHDGADILLDYLLNADDIVIMAGKSVNPAHQNPNFPLQINLKAQVVEKLVEVLRELGKNVIVEWY